MKVSIITMACLNDRAGIDPMPTYRALENVVASFSLGDHIYGDGTSIRNALALDAVEFPRGSGLVLTIPAAVDGVIPTGSLTVTAGGTGYPVSRSNALVFWITDPTTGAATAHGTLTTNSSGVITAATLKYGGRAGDYSHATSRAFTDDVDLYTWSHPKAWAYRSSAVVLATGPMRKFWALPIKRYLAPDDHEAWNGGFPGAYITKAPATVDTKAKSYAFWQTASQGVRLLIDQDFHNPAWTDPVTPYVPSGLSGLGLSGTEPFFKIRYFYVDITKTGPVAAPCGANNPPVPGTIARVIVPDLLFEKGDYTIGSDDATRLLSSMVQESWIDAVQASAVAGGVRSICIASSKDRGGQNSDGWWSHVTQWERINTNIQAKNYPTFWVTGDRHVPHTGSWRVANGDNYDLEVICPTALGATSEAIVRYKQMDWADQSPDVPVLGSVVWDTDAQTTTITIHDMATARGRRSVVIPFGQRKASRYTGAAARTIRPVASPFTQYRFTSTEFSSLTSLVSGDWILPPARSGSYAVKMGCGASSTPLTAGYTSCEQKPLDVYPFYGLRLALVNYGSSAYTLDICKVACAPTDLNSGTSLTWQTVTVNGSNSITVPAMTQGSGGTAPNNRIAGVVWTDFIPLVSVARTDTPTDPYLIQVRGYGSGVINCTGGPITRANGSTPYLLDRGYKFGWQQAVGDAVTTISGVTPSNASALGLVGHVEVYTGRPHFQLYAFGDSLLAGYSGTADGAQIGWPNMVDYLMRSSGRIGGIANWGVGGMLHANYIATMKAVITAGAKPSAAYFSAMSPNSGGTSQSQWDAAYGLTLEAVHWLRSRGIAVYVSTAMPANGYNDTMRKAFNARLKAELATVCTVWDFASVVEDPANTAQMLSAYNYDNVHQTPAGQLAIANYVAAQLGL